MNQVRNIREGFKKLAGQHGPLQTILGTVISVDASELTCVVDNDGTEIYDVQLRPVINGNESMTLLPKVGGYVLITRIEDDENWMVIAADEIDKMRVVIGTSVFEMTAAGYSITKGADSLKDVLQLIIEATQQIVVMMGNNPNYVKLTQALVKLNNIMQ